MALVSYSDSETSDAESTSTPAPAKASQPGFKKVVDRSNAHKIRVTLPKYADEDELDADKPPAKKVKTGGGMFSGFNSMLPAPKNKTVQSGGGALGIGKPGGLGKGVSLKTGAAPGFTREPENKIYGQDDNEEDGVDAKMTIPEPQATNRIAQSPPPNDKPPEEPKMVGNPMMFKPLSVARKPQKKPVGGGLSDKTISQETMSEPKKAANKPRPKVSLFSMSSESMSTTPSSTSVTDYQPLVYEDPSKQQTAGDEASRETELATQTLSKPPSQTAQTSGPQTLDSIASDLNLSASARRQLIGRRRGTDGSSTVNVINFNTDLEYKTNEELRVVGDTVQHNPVRSIAPGKHSLKQLINAASSQREALEESFATGKANKREAGSKYGW
jgi:hypothetical protein